MQAKVPKFIDVEDKVIGPFTWKQFAYVGFGLAIAFFAVSFFETFIGFPIALSAFSLGIALAFVKINGRSFTIFLMSMWNYNFNPRRYSWQKEAVARTKIKLQAGKKDSPAGETTSSYTRQAEALERFRNIARSLDVHQSPEERRRKEEKNLSGMIVQNFSMRDKASKSHLIYPELHAED